MRASMHGEDIFSKFRKQRDKQTSTATAGIQKRIDNQCQIVNKTRKKRVYGVVNNNNNMSLGFC